MVGWMNQETKSISCLPETLLIFYDQHHLLVKECTKQGQGSKQVSLS